MSEPDESGQLLRNLVLFGRLLRSAGLRVTSSRIAELAEAMGHLGLERREDFKNAARAMLVSRREHLALFDQAFDLFWRRGRDPSAPPIDLGQILKKTYALRREAIVTGREAALGEGAAQGEPKIEKRYTYSDREVLRRKDFAKLTADELGEVKELMREMSWDLELRRSRRKVRARSGVALDLRRTLAQSLRRGAETLTLAWRQRKLKRRPLVLLCDVSGSMEPYSRLLLQFVYGITNGLEKVEAFVFGTRLTRITRVLHDTDVDRALARVSDAVKDWGGGTRIGEALKTFNFDWGRRVLTAGAIVMVISDGWDRGDVELLERELDRLRRSCRRLIWLNPLLGSPGYEPLTRGIQAALPFIDDFLPVHNLESLEQLGQLLGRLGEHRPGRRAATGQRPAQRLEGQPAQASSADRPSSVAHRSAAAGLRT